jgi:hypothetical protein
MTNKELIDQAMSRLGQRTSVRVRADVITEINAALDNVERGTFFPWFLEETATLDISVGDTFKALPSDFAREAEESRPYYVLEGKLYYLTKRFYGTLLGETPTKLQYYAIRGNDFHFRMPADIAYTVYVDYYARQGDPLADNTDPVSNLWLIHAKDWVVNMGLSVVAGLHLHNDKLEQKLFARAEKGKNDLYVYHESRINENQDFAVGGATDGS